MRRAAFTLLETMLAISLTASVGIAALTLNALQARIGTAARAQEGSLALITETVRLLDGDLVLAVPLPDHSRFQVLEQGALRLVTSCRLPGESPELHQVVWSFEAASGTVRRTSTALSGGPATTRSVGRDWKMFAIALDQDALWLDARIGSSDLPWSLPLWTDRP